MQAKGLDEVAAYPERAADEDLVGLRGLGDQFFT